MKFIAACSKLPRIVLAIAAISLGACATDGSERARTICPPAAPYPASVQARAADECEALPPGSAIEAMLADYSTMRAQAHVCGEGAGDGPW
jgi:hypothetical protein